jgi:hypothetical protein
LIQDPVHIPYIFIFFKSQAHATWNNPIAYHNVLLNDLSLRWLWQTLFMWTTSRSYS